MSDITPFHIEDAQPLVNTSEPAVNISEKKNKKKVSRFLLKKFQENHLKLGGILTTRFNAKTLVENRSFLENINSTGDKNHGIACIYCAPSEISEKIPIGSRCAVLEMDNDANMIIGIGLIENKACKKKISVYEWGYYNRVNYIGYFRIERKDMSPEELKTMAVLELKCFKGSGHLKRGKGLTMFPIAYLFELFENDIDVETIIREMFNRRFLTSSSS